MSISILSYNIQAAIGTQAYREYVTKARHQLFNTPKKSATLSAIAEFISTYDVACIQEVDLGGRRAGFKCQVDRLHSLSNFTDMSSQENRVVGNISRHGNAILSKYPQSDVTDLKLPGKRAGRGAILARIESPKPFFVLNVHLSLGQLDQMTQVKYLIDEAPKEFPLIIAGDFNCGSASLPIRTLARELNLAVLTEPHHKTYPSWNPRKGFDHILASTHFSAHSADVIDVKHSDHRPIVCELRQ